MLSLAVKIPVEKENADSIKPVYKFATAFLNHRLFLLLHLLCPSCFTVQCNATLLAMEDVVESPDPTTSSSYSPLECTYSITVYAGYGVEIQVMCIKIHKHLNQLFLSSLLLKKKKKKPNMLLLINLSESVCYV